MAKSSTSAKEQAWREAVVSAPADQLVALLSSRPDLAARNPGDLEGLAGMVVEPRSVRAAYEMANRASQELLEALCVLADPTSEADLEVALAVAPSGLTALLDDLVSSFLVRRTEGGLSVNPGLVGLLRRPGRLGPSLRGVLQAQAMGLLSEVASRAGLAVAKSKGAAVDRLVEQLSDPSTIARLLEAGPAGTRALAERVALDGPEVELGMEPYTVARSDATPAGYLLRRGLLVSSSWSRAIMPADVALALRGGRVFPRFRVDPPPVALVPLAGPAARMGPDGGAAEAAQSVVADLTRLLDLWGGPTPPRLLQAGGLGVREVRRAAKAIGRSEAEVARLVELAAGTGLVTPDPIEPVVLPTEAYDEWRALTTAGRWTILVGSWLLAPVHLSLAGSLDEDGKAIPPLGHRDLEPGAVGRRAAVLDLLGQLPDDQTPDKASLAERLSWLRPSLWREGPAGGATLVEWIVGEAELLGVAFEGRLASFGRAAASGELSEAKALLEAVLPPVVTDLVLQADLTALAAGELEPALRAELELMADVESTGAATCWRFSPRSIERALDAGRTGDQLVATLSAHAPKGVPQALTYLIEDLGRRFGRLRLGSASCYLRAEEPGLLAELVQARRTAKLHLRLLAPTVAVSDRDPGAVLVGLRDAGYLAAAEEADGTLSITRPPAHRATTADRLGEMGLDDDDDDFSLDLDGAELGDLDLGDLDLDDALKAVLLGEPDLLAALTGMSPEVVSDLFPPSRPGRAQAEAVDVDDLVHRLLHPEGVPPQARPSGAKGTGQPKTTSRGTAKGPARLRLVEGNGR